MATTKTTTATATTTPETNKTTTATTAATMETTATTATAEATIPINEILSSYSRMGMIVGHAATTFQNTTPANRALGQGHTISSMRRSPTQ